jgi:hypothetical protein
LAVAFASAFAFASLSVIPPGNLLLLLPLLFWPSFPLGICFFFCLCFSGCHSERSEEPASRSHRERPFLPLPKIKKQEAPASQTHLAAILPVLTGRAVLNK